MSARYTVLRFDVEAAEAEAWSDALLAAGALAVDVSDPLAGTAKESPVYAEPELPAFSPWPISRLSALFDAATDAHVALAAAARSAGRSVPPWESASVAEQDWVRASQSQFGPIRIADDFWIVPTWCEPPVPAALNIALDPGVAFGTGSHPTTQLCLEWLRGEVTSASEVLDYGCGSGILAIAAGRLGARRVVGVDIDRQAVAAAKENARRNNVTASFVEARELPAGRFDLLVANILARPLIELAPRLASRLREHGRIALAGILDAQAQDVLDAYGRWFNIAPWRARDGWTLLAGVRRAGPRVACVSS